MKITVLLLLAAIVIAAIALGQDVAIGQETEAAKDLAKFIPGGWLAKLATYMVGAMLILRGLAEGLTRISKMTENKWDNKAAHYLSQATWILGVALGKLGYSVPKLVLEEAKKDGKKGS